MSTHMQYFIHEMYLIQNRPSFKTILQLLEAANGENCINACRVRRKGCHSNDIHILMTIVGNL